MTLGLKLACWSHSTAASGVFSVTGIAAFCAEMIDVHSPDARKVDPMPELSTSIQHDPHSVEKPDSYPSPLANGTAKLCPPRVATVAGLHLLALLVFVPWFFSWAGVALFVTSIFLIGTVGIDIG